MAKLSESYIYDKELSLSNYARHIISTYDDIKITKENLDIEYEIFKNMRNVPMLHDIIKLFEMGKIRFVRTNTPNNTLTYIPYKEGANSYVIVNVTSYIDKIDGDKYTIESRNIYGLLLVATGILISFDTNNYIGYAVVKEALVSVYTEMFIKVLNRVSNIATTDDNSLFVKYIITYWALARNGLCDAKNITGYSMKISKCGDLNKITSFNMKYDFDKMNQLDIQQFIDDVLKVEFPFASSKITLPYLIQSYTSIYGSSCTLGLDYLPYISGVILSYYATYNVFRNKIFAKELNPEIRTAATVLYQLVDNRIKLM